MKAIARRAKIEIDRLQSRRTAADISFFHTFVPPPYGGGNQFLRALWNELARRRWRLENNTISPSTRACLYNSFNFDLDRLRRFRRDGCLMVHRVDGPVSVYRGDDDGTDRRVWESNRDLADVTVFQSRYSLDRHAQMGLTFRNASVITNAVDPNIFHAEGRASRAHSGRIRLIATSWSPNPNKGADVYAWLDDHLDWSRFEFTFVGQSPVTFNRIRMVPPVPSEQVASLLREHDIFITASRHESCSNALIEALSCGLPAVYHQSGGNPEIVGEAGIAFDRADQVPDALHRMAADLTAWQSRIRVPALTSVADRYLEVMGLSRVPEAA